MVETVMWSHTARSHQAHSCPAGSYQLKRGCWVSGMLWASPPQLTGSLK